MSNHAQALYWNLASGFDNDRHRSYDIKMPKAFDENAVFNTAGFLGMTTNLTHEVDQLYIERETGRLLCPMKVQP